MGYFRVRIPRLDWASSTSCTIDDQYRYHTFQSMLCTTCRTHQLNRNHTETLRLTNGNWDFERNLATPFYTRRKIKKKSCPRTMSFNVQRHNGLSKNRIKSAWKQWQTNYETTALVLLFVCLSTPCGKHVFNTVDDCMRLIHHLDVPVKPYDREGLFRGDFFGISNLIRTFSEFNMEIAGRLISEYQN